MPASSTISSALPKRRRGVGRTQPSASSSQDASDEDNDATDDAASAISIDAISASRPLEGQPQSQGSGIRGLAGATKKPSVGSSSLGKAVRVEELEAGGSASEGVDSPTYDGDVESINPALHSTHITHSHSHPYGTQHAHGRETSADSSSTLSASSSASSLGKATQSPRQPTPKATRSHSNAHPSVHVPPVPAIPSSSLPSAASDDGPPKMLTRPKLLPVEEIRAFVRRAIEGKGEEDGVIRDWTTAEPATDRPVRIYADGVYDLFHFGHALQLRQAKLSFPNVHLIVGVCSDELCASHKSAPAMTHAERMESVSNCRWVDEIAPEAPWLVDQEWLDRYKIDYVAHDEEVYPAKGVKDAYDFVKRQGTFLPTRRTPSISTSDLLERIVRGYRSGFFDSKLEKNGHPELMASDVDWDSSASCEKVAAREKRRVARQAGQAGQGSTAAVGKTTAGVPAENK